ncbi:TPA: phage terminase small subunit P27 family [Clostridium perfringens]|uniref:Phage terminase, small subunit n=1 Tax=Clostridium perfringens (strain ATCC 13124 / DSM 756 / JCM 1290 / NCIMB 6125 / NCTC 8237 / Type A) TaxID=195103 RepID=A0A0H2YUW8_CLOP1|nr:phage terminase small subunit P27 family [Clostridium perfringens]ABG84927.1 putative phage terminase, small subunit [Clostridium perfringens ATCC 13124]
MLGLGRKMISVSQIIANGNKSHLTNEEIEKRQEQEEKLKKLPRDKIRPPTWLSKDGKSIFKKIVKELEAVDILANIDNYNLAVLANSIEKYIECTMKLNCDELTVTHINKQGSLTTQKNPLISIQIQYADVIKKLGAEFGLSPAARLKIIQEASDIDDDEKAFNKDFGNV